MIPAISPAPRFSAMASGPRQIVVRQPEAAQAVSAAEDMHAFLCSDTSGFLAARSVEKIERAIASRDVWLAHDAISGELVGCAAIFSVGGRREFGAVRSAAAGLGLQRRMLLLRLQRELDRVGHAGQIYSAVARSNPASMRALVRCGFRETAPDEAFFKATGANREKFAGPLALLTIDDEAARTAVRQFASHANTAPANDSAAWSVLAA